MPGLPQFAKKNHDRRQAKGTGGMSSNSSDQLRSAPAEHHGASKPPARRPDTGSEQSVPPLTCPPATLSQPAAPETAPDDKVKKQKAGSGGRAWDIFNAITAWERQSQLLLLS
jgi:hypothetical protein